MNFTRFKNKLKRLPRKIGAWLIVKSAKSGMDYFGWKRLRWHEDVNGMWLVYYVCKDFPKPGELPPGDNGIIINGLGGSRCNANGEANGLSRHQESCKAEDILPEVHPSQDGTRVHHDRKVQGPDHGIPHRNTDRCQGQC